MISAWTPAHIAAIDMNAVATVPSFEPVARPDGGEGRYYWDMWPVQDPDGKIVPLGDREIWMALSAPDHGDPALRHFEAEIRWLERTEHGWADRGRVLPEFDVPYEREWAGSALLDNGRLTLFYTGAGLASQPGGYQQQLYQTSAPVSETGTVGSWTTPRLSVTEMTTDYQPADAQEGEPGRIKAFRDPAYFRDPANGGEYLVFTASLAEAATDYNGAVGIARRDGEGWSLLPPLVHADGVNNELERAHVVFHTGSYFVFWVTQHSTFAPGVPVGPTGLYGMVASSLAGPWRPIGGSGLVLANPSAQPRLAYSWVVSADGTVASFADEAGGSVFAGVPAPVLHLQFAEDRCPFFAWD